MLHFKVGPGIGLRDTGGVDRPAFSTASAALELAARVTPRHCLYVVTSFQVQPGAWYIAFLLSAGFEYDFKLGAKGFKILPIFYRLMLYTGYRF